MAKKAKPAPRGYRTVTPYLIIKDAASAIDFYKQAFQAKVLMCLSEPSGKVGHAEIKIGDSRIMLADEYPELGSRGPQSFGGSPVSILLYVEDCDDMFERAIAKGARVVKAMRDQFYGDRAGTLEDPFGHVWTIAHHIRLKIGANRTDKPLPTKILFADSRGFTRSLRVGKTVNLIKTLNPACRWHWGCCKLSKTKR
jgi:PhnB protein